MQVREPLAEVGAAATGSLPVPLLARVGAAVIAAGLAFDLAAHTVLHSVHDELIGAFPLGEHLAHLIVVVGMVLVLAGVLADGIRMQRRLGRHKERE
ncbi:MAG TPA: hypothetical protein VNL94_07235 [Candidatus Binatia bacterium]|nr:hypothetical protein [Candidatus Binatia bacterium]